jgi:hypothetical protein
MPIRCESKLEDEGKVVVYVCDQLDWASHMKGE